MGPDWVDVFPIQNGDILASYVIVYQLYLKITLPETNISPENGWLEDDPFLLGFGQCLGANC